MRIVAATLTLFLACSMGPDVGALSVCPTSEFTISFDPESAELDPGDLETLDAASARMRQCDVSAIELVVAGSWDEQGLVARRLSAVRHRLVQNGSEPRTFQAVNESREMYGYRVSPTPDAVTVLIFFDYSS